MFSIEDNTIDIYILCTHAQSYMSLIYGHKAGYHLSAVILWVNKLLSDKRPAN